MSTFQLPGEIRELFPYDELRIGQKEIIERIYSAVRNKKHVIIVASNGVGKTISALAATLPIALEFDLKIVYLSRTHTQLERVIDELISIYRKKGITIPAIELRARRDMCLHRMIKGRKISAYDAIDICHILKKTKRCPYFENLKNNKLTYNLLKQIYELPLKSRDLISIGEQNRVCPYELNKYLIENAKVISAPYIYLLDERIREIFLKNLGEYMGRIIFIFDEAHNLPFIATETNSYALSQNTVSRAINEARNFKLPRSEEILLKIEKFLNELMMEKPGEAPISKDELMAYLSPIEYAIITLKNEGDIVKDKKLKADKLPISYISSVAKFLMAWEDSDPETHAYIITTKRGQKSLIAYLEIVSLDARESIAPLLESVATVSLSGTLHRSYAEITGIAEHEYDYFEAPLPYGKHQYLILGVDNVTSRLEDRTAAIYRNILRYIESAVLNTPYNVGVFFPSYDVLQDMINIGITETLEKSGKEIFVEKPTMTSLENERMIMKYKKAAYEKGGVLLGVMGGRNCEGTDYPGREMETAIIVGIPLAKPTVRVQASIRYFEKIYGRKGKLYSYVIPAIYKASQTAGRVIRSPEDRGVILLVDKRYLWGYYRELLPMWLRKNIIRISSPHEAKAMIANFFRKNNNK